jgi:hypothetical protein
MAGLKLEIKRDSKYRIKIEIYQEFKNSFLSDVYDKAWDIFKEIIDNSRKKSDNCNNKSKCKENYIQDQEIDNENRMIAFVGERGTGKTSAMYSFANALLCCGYIESKDPKIGKICFEKIIIDPAFFEDHENILEIVIAKLFENFKQILDNTEIKDKYHDKKNLLDLFEKVFKNIKTIEKKDKFIDNDEIVEKISNLASSSQLIKNFETLFENYLAFKFSKENCANKFILFLIDDFDLNIKKGNEIAEQIRKYLLNQPNVIILSSLNFDDLKNLIDKGFSEILEILLKNNFIESKDISVKTYRYLQKFIPISRRIDLPEIQKKRKEAILLLDFDQEIKILIDKIKDFIKIIIIDFINKNYFKTSLNNEQINELETNFLEDIIKVFKSYNDIEEINNSLIKINGATSVLIDDFLIKILGREFVENFNNLSQRKHYSIYEKNQLITPNKIKELFMNYLEKELKSTVEKKLLDLIKTKTSLIFIESPEIESETLVPDSIRELRNLIFKLYEFDSNTIKNIDEFERLIFNNFVTKDLNAKSKIFIYLLNNTENTKKNEIIIRYLLKEHFNTDISSENTDISYSLYQLIYLLDNLPINDELNKLSYLIKIIYSIKFNKLLLNFDYINLLKVIGGGVNKTSEKNLFKDFSNKYQINSREFKIKPVDNYKKIRTFFRYINEDNQKLFEKINLFLQNLPYSDLKNITFNRVKDEIQKSFILPLIKKNLLNALEKLKDSFNDNLKDFEGLLHSNENLFIYNSVQDALNSLIALNYFEQELSYNNDLELEILILFLKRVIKILDIRDEILKRVFHLPESKYNLRNPIIDNAQALIEEIELFIPLRNFIEKEKLNWLPLDFSLTKLENIGLNEEKINLLKPLLGKNYSRPILLKELDNLQFANEDKNLIINTVEFFDEIKIQITEWIFYFFKFFNKEEIYLSQYKRETNFFDRFISSFNDDRLRAFLDFDKERNFNFIDLISFEFFVYDSEELGMAMPNPLNKEENWNENRLSMNQKIKDWQEKGYLSALPLYSMDILKRILLDPFGLLYYITKGGEPFPTPIKGFYSIANSRISDFNNDYLNRSLKESPMFSPFLIDSNKNDWFLAIFEFVFGEITDE